MVAEKKNLQEKTFRERRIADIKLDDLQATYDDAREMARWDKKSECYIDRKGNPVVDSSEVVYDDLLELIPLSGEYYSKRDADKDYVPNLQKKIREVMTASLRKRDKERLKKSDDESLEKTVGEAGEESQKTADEKLKKPAEEVVEKQKVIEEVQKQTTKEAEVSKTKVITQIESSELLNKIDNKTKEQCKKCVETCSACTEKKMKNIKPEI
ncbi:hypothetical protein Hanom_Chr13g01218431 [Helianthus anomalus]